MSGAGDSGGVIGRHKKVCVSQRFGCHREINSLPPKIPDRLAVQVLLSPRRENVSMRGRLFRKAQILWIAFAARACLLAQNSPAQEPEQGPVISRDVIPPNSNEEPQPANSPYPAKVADGQTHGLPVEALAVAPGTRFLVALETELNTGAMKRNQQFRLRTVEPLEASHGIYLPSGAIIRGHVSRVDPAGNMGRAKLWLTFDEIRTRFGSLPIVAEVAEIPGDHSIKPGPVQEGVIQGRSSTQKDAAQSAAAGAFIGAEKGVKDKDKKEAAEGAALGALQAYLAEAGRGQELDLPKGAKLELELERALYLVKE
jgi:hypothetical protein